MSADLRPMDTAPEGKRVLVKADDGEWYVAAHFCNVWLYADLADSDERSQFEINPVGWLPLPD